MFESLGVDGRPFADLPNADATLVGFATGHASPAVRDRVYREVIHATFDARKWDHLRL